MPAGPRPLTRYADGEWHHLHPATPLLRGGIALIAVAGIIISQFRERLVDFFLHTPNYPGDPIDQIYDRGLTGWVLLGVFVVILLAVAGFYASWRMSTFRIGDEAVEVRSGILSRSHRKARLDRIQGINVQRPLFARIFGAAKLEIHVAGHDANVHLSYLGSSLAEDLRRDILRLASGAQMAEHPVQRNLPTAPGAAPAPLPGAPRSGVSDFVAGRVDEFLSPADLDPDAAPPASIVTMHPVRLAGSLLLSGFTLFMLALIAAIILGAATGRVWVLITILPSMIGAFGYYTRRFSKAVRYSISGTPDGVRIGFGLLTTGSETLPPGRIHAVEVRQPVLWRPFGWWQVRINTATRSRGRDSAGEARTTMLPVGNASDVLKVLPLALPGMPDGERTAVADAAMSKAADQSVFSAAPPRARWLRPFSWRRTGYAILGDIVVLRHGFLSRRLVYVPLARMQSVEIAQGPARRILDLAEARVHTVEGPVRPTLSVLSVADARVFFDRVASGAVTAASSDRSHRWNAGGAGA